MIAKLKAAALVVAGGALLGGCAQTPGIYSQPGYQPAPSGYFDAAWAAQQEQARREQEQRAYIEQLNAWAAQQQQTYIEQLDAWRRQQLQRRSRQPYSPPSSDDDGPVISENPPAQTPAPQAPADPDCVGWWRICHFL
jgi:hypothetical protein